MNLSGFTAGQLAALTILVFFAGLVDALAGGGGLITLPAYLSSGLSPALVLGTNKLSSSIGTVVSCLKYQRHQRLNLSALAPALLVTALGSFLGAKLTAWLDPRWLRPILLGVIPVVAFLLYSRKAFGHSDESAGLTASELRRRETLVSLSIGAYDGFIGPGTGTFFALALSRWCRYDLLGATARAKFLNLTTNVAALAAFLLAGRVHVALGLAMAAAGMAGHYAGSHLGLKNGPRIIRPAVLAVCAGLFVKLLLDLRR